jgi:hypothetical protein
MRPNEDGGRVCEDESWVCDDESRVCAGTVADVRGWVRVAGFGVWVRVSEV